MRFDELYEVSELKRKLAARGIERGFAEFCAAYRALELRGLSFSLRSAREFAEHKSSTLQEIAPAGIPFAIRAPIVIGQNDSHSYAGLSRAMFVCSFDNALVMGRSSIIRTGGYALSDFQGHELEYSRDRFETDASVFARRGSVVYVVERKTGPAFRIDEAFVSLLAPQSDAFGHWIAHQIPRFVTALVDGNIHDMPVLVDGGMHQSHYDALRLAIGNRAMPLVEVDCAASVLVGRAWYASAPLYVPYLPVRDEHWTWEQLATPPERWRTALEAMTESVSAIEQQGSGERIYLARPRTLRRRLVNAQKIEDIARARGFKILYPEQLSFRQQVNIVRQARYVLGPEGSAFFLNFYGRPGLKVAVLSHPFTDILTNAASALAGRGIHVTVFTGPVVNANFSHEFPGFGYRHFADYEIDENAFADFLDDWSPS